MPPDRDEQGRFKRAGKGRKAQKPCGTAKSPPPAPAPAMESGIAAADADAVPAGPSESFLSELHASWARHGAATIEKVRNDRPHDYLRLMASSLPKQIEGKDDAIDAMSDDEVAEELRRVLDRLGAGSAGAGAGTGAAKEA